MRRKNTILLVVLMAVIPLAACASSVPIERIKTEPAQYAGQEVTIRGTVDNVIGIPFTLYSIYMLSDGTGRMPVFSDIERQEGEEVTVTAKVAGYGGEGPSAETQRSLQALSDFLVERHLANREFADALAGTVLDIIRTLTDTAEGSYFLLEKSDREAG